MTFYKQGVERGVMECNNSVFVPIKNLDNCIGIIGGLNGVCSNRYWKAFSLYIDKRRHYLTRWEGSLSAVHHFQGLGEKAKRKNTGVLVESHQFSWR